MHAGVPPKLAGHLQGLDVGLLPRGFLVLCPMNFPVVNPAERNGELVACLAAKRTADAGQDVFRGKLHIR